LKGFTSVVYPTAVKAFSRFALHYVYFTKGDRIIILLQNIQLQIAMQAY